jgi:hypothetical protein
MTETEAGSVFWLGGGSGAGKSTLARAVAGRLDLAVYHVDVFGYEHLRRMRRGPFPETQAFNHMSYAQRWLRDPKTLAAQFLTLSRERMPLILEDVATLVPGPTILAEGPQLLPELVAPLLGGTAGALWLLPTADVGRRGVAARAEEVPISEEERASENRYQRDVLVTSALRQGALELGLGTVEVDGRRSLADTVDVLAHLLTDMPGGVRRAESGSQRAGIRHRENLAMASQLTAYREDLGIEALPDAPVGPFWCECRELGCDSEVVISADDYLQRRSEGPVVTHAG